jgi:transcriptional regulator with XRE-family HTH domain
MREWLTRPGGLAHRLKGMRERAGFAGYQFADTLDWDRTKVSKIENGRTMPSEADIRAWVAACDYTTKADSLADELIALRDEGSALHQRWRRRLRDGQVAIQTEWDELIRAAEAIFNFEMAAIPGLLQTTDYARAMMLQAVRFHEASEDGIEPAIAARVRRQQALYDSAHNFRFVIWEAALRAGAAPPAVMIGQLHSLAGLAQLPHVTIGIIPLGRPLRVMLQNPFIAVDDTVRYETFGGLVTVVGDEAESYLNLVGPLMELAATDWREPSADNPDGGDAYQIIKSVTAWWRSRGD